MTKRNILLISTLIFLAGCSPKYHKGNIMAGGYTSNRLGENIYQVAYRPGLFLNHKDLSKKDLVIMKRAAELTVESGFTHFTHTYNSLTEGFTIHLYKDNEEGAPQDAINAKDFLAYN